MFPSTARTLVSVTRVNWLKCQIKTSGIDHMLCIKENEELNYLLSVPHSKRLFLCVSLRRALLGYFSGEQNYINTVGVNLNAA